MLEREEADHYDVHRTRDVFLKADVACRRSATDLKTQKGEVAGDASVRQDVDTEGTDGGTDHVDEGTQHRGNNGRHAAVMMTPTVPGQIVWLRPKTHDSKTTKAPKEIGEGDAGDVVAEKGLKFDRVLVTPDAATLGVIRLANQAMDDHYLDQYRMGLDMRAREPFDHTR
jgi:hypothetical protein